MSTSPANAASELLSRLRGLAFAKMTGSGNDFVFFDARTTPIDLVTQPEAIKAICNRYNGIGADGIVVLEPLREGLDVRVHYYNSDGTAADLCGNATLCATAISAQWGLTSATGMRLATGVGLINSRLEGLLPAISLQPVTDIRPDMPISLKGPTGSRVGFAMAGIPHLVILCEDADVVDVAGAGPALRRHEATGPAGANVNWVSPRPDGSWRYRTFERGVEGETLACGTGAVATAVLLRAWGLSDGSTTTIRTSSGRDVQVDLEPLTGAAEGSIGGFRPTLRGEGRVVFRGEIEAL